MSWEAGLAGVGHAGPSREVGQKGRYLCGRWKDSVKAGEELETT